MTENVPVIVRNELISYTSGRIYSQGRDPYLCGFVNKKMITNKNKQVKFEQFTD